MPFLREVGLSTGETLVESPHAGLMHCVIASKQEVTDWCDFVEKAGGQKEQVSVTDGTLTKNGPVVTVYRTVSYSIVAARFAVDPKPRP